MTRIAPGLEGELTHGVSGDVLLRVLRDEIDAGYFLGELNEAGSSLDPASIDKIHQHKLGSFSYLVIAPPGWDTKIRGKGWDELVKLPWIGTRPSSVHYRLLTRIFDDLGVSPQTVARVDQELSMLAMVRSGVGLSLCRDSLAWHERQANGISVSDHVQIKTSISFIALKSRISDPRISCLFDAMSRVWLDK